MGASLIALFGGAAIAWPLAAREVSTEHDRQKYNTTGASHAKADAFQTRYA
jgi:hypothetical protein